MLSDEARDGLISQAKGLVITSPLDTPTCYHLSTDNGVERTYSRHGLLFCRLSGAGAYSGGKFYLSKDGQYG